MEWGRLAVDELKRELSGEKHRPRIAEREQAAAQEAIKELEGIYADHKDREPLKTIEKMLRSENKFVFKLGVKIVRKGTFTEALPILEKVNPAEAAMARQVIENRLTSKAVDQPIETLREKRIAWADERIKDLHDAPQSRQGFCDLRGTTNVYFGDDLDAWEKWLNENKPYLGCLAVADGILYVDEEAKASGVPWIEWRRFSQEERSAKLAGVKVPEKWRMIHLIMECYSGDPRVKAMEYDYTWAHLDPAGNGFIYWLYWQTNKLTEESPGWEIEIVVVDNNDKERVETVAARCKALGFRAKTVLYKSRD